MKNNHTSASTIGSGDPSPFKDLTNIPTDGDAAITCNQQGQQKKTNGQGWYARLTPEKKAEYLEKLRIVRQQKKAASMSTVKGICPTKHMYCGYMCYYSPSLNVLPIYFRCARCNMYG